MIDNQIEFLEDEFRVLSRKELEEITRNIYGISRFPVLFDLNTEFNQGGLHGKIVNPSIDPKACYTKAIKESNYD